MYKNQMPVQLKLWERLYKNFLVTLEQKLLDVRMDLSSAYNDLYDLASERDEYSDIMEKISNAIDFIFELEQNERSKNNEKNEIK